MSAQLINKEKVSQINSQYLQQQQNIQMQLKEGIQPITIEHIPLIKKILAKTFLERNDIWKSFALNIDQIQEFFERTVYLHLQCQEKARKKLGPAFTTEWTFVKNGKITSSFHHFQIEVYRQVIMKSNAEEKLEVFKTLEKEGKKLIEGIDLYQYAPGTAVYMNFGGSNSQLHLGPLDVYHILNSYNLALKKCGVRWIVGRSSNMRATRHYIKVGGRVVKEISFERDGLKFPLYFFELDMENPKFLEAEKSYTQVEKKFLQLAKQQAKL